MERKGITEEIARRIMKIQSEFENESYDILSVENNGDFELFPTAHGLSRAELAQQKFCIWCHL